MELNQLKRKCGLIGERNQSFCGSQKVKTLETAPRGKLFQNPPVGSNFPYGSLPASVALLLVTIVNTVFFFSLPSPNLVLLFIYLLLFISLSFHIPIYYYHIPDNSAIITPPTYFHHHRTEKRKEENSYLNF